MMKTKLRLLFLLLILFGWMLKPVGPVLGGQKFRTEQLKDIPSFLEGMLEYKYQITVEDV